jgi:DNA-binding transcriptional ArsR family regulator
MAHTRDQLFDFIVAYKRLYDGNSPSLREMSAALEGLSISVVNYHLKGLERAGRIVLGGFGRSRSIGVVGGQWRFEPETLEPQYRSLEIAPGVIAHLGPDASQRTIDALRELASVFIGDGEP